MEPIKFEDNIREKLQEREITPSNKSWEKLTKQLKTSKTNKRSNNSYWFAIAAGFIGIVIVASFIFKDEVIPSQLTPKLVEEKIQKNTKKP
jgi:formate/nitrite transporter FocA (FNT family)